jgi:hypothetical protein
MNSKIKKKSTILLCGTAALALMLGAMPAHAASHSGGQGGTTHAEGGGHDDGAGHEGGAGGKRMRRGGDAARGGGMGGGSLRDVFRDMEEEAGVGHDDGDHEEGGGRPATAGGGKPPTAGTGGGRPATAGPKGGRPEGHETAEGEEEDSDRPEWAGVPGPESKPGGGGGGDEAGTKRGTIYGDMYIVLRDENGVPELDGEYEQVYYVVVDADGNPILGDDGNPITDCCIPRNDEGDLLGELPDGTLVVPIEVELGRLSVGRSPDRVLAAQLDDAITAINDASTIVFDEAGRIVLTYDDGTVKTIDSPLQNLALYTELLNTGTIADVDGDALAALGIDTSDGLSEAEFDLAASLFGAASDKVIEINVDSIAYENEILGIVGALPDGYVDYSDFTYDRQTAYPGTITVVLQNSEGEWVETEVSIYEDILGGEPTGTLENIAAFTTAADDARTIIDYIHANLVVTN